MNHEVRIRINAWPDVVWDTLADVERWPEWTRSVRSVELLDGNLAVGHRKRIRQPMFPSVGGPSVGSNPVSRSTGGRAGWGRTPPVAMQ